MLTITRHAHAPYLALELTLPGDEPRAKPLVVMVLPDEERALAMVADTLETMGYRDFRPPEPPRPTEQDLEILWEFISGVGRFAFLGRGMWTYPGSAEDGGKHAACEVLEARGAIRRKPASTETWVLWEPVR